ILWVSTWNQPINDLSGRNILHSWLKFKHDGKFLIGLEGMKEDGLMTSAKFIRRDITNDRLYWDWVEKFKEYIPSCYGGIKDDWSKEIEKDPKRASYSHQTARWFKKIVILKRSLEYVQPNDIIIFLDADQVFL